MGIEELRYADFRRIDLNLLVAFDALMEERQVGRAAAKVFIGQPAMSHALQRLRDALNDDLFVRSGNRMEPTALALELAPRVRAWLNDANTFLFARESFDLSRISATITVAVTDSVETVLLPQLMSALREAAPGICIRTRHMPREEILAALDAGEIDMAIGPGELRYKEWHHTELIARTPYECVFAPSQLSLPEKITAEVLAAHEHVALSWRDTIDSEIDQFLEMRGFRRNIAVSANSQLAIIRILENFPVMTLQTSLLSSIYRDFPTIEVRPIQAEGLNVEVTLIWHRRNHREPAQLHVRSLIKEILMR